MKRTYLAALVVAALFVLWLASGMLDGSQEHTPAPSLAQSRDAMLVEQDDTPVRVRARVLNAEVQTGDIVVRGRTQADRSVVVRAETSGKVVELPVEKGDHVARGDLLCRLDTEARAARVKEAEEAAAQARIEYEGAQKLARRGLQSETAIATSRANLAAREADFAQRRLDLDNTRIRAPFDGIVETRPVEIGDYVQPGGVCASVIDPDPMKLVGQVAERDVARLHPGDTGHGHLITGEDVQGTVVFVAHAADPDTRTFRVEVAVPNPDGQLRDGITTELRLPVEQFRAQRIPSALLALDDAGRLGIRILDSDNVVHFVNVDVVKDTVGGIWVTGLPDPATVITVGQELVTPGQKVDPTFEAGGPMSDSGSAPVAEEGKDAAAEPAQPTVGAEALAQPRAAGDPKPAVTIHAAA